MTNYSYQITPDTLEAGKIIHQSDPYAEISAPREGMQLVLTPPASAYPSSAMPNLTNAHYLVFDIEIMEEHSGAFDLLFWENDHEGEHDMRIMFGILPAVRTVVPVPLALLDSQELFPERTPDRLKMGVFGKPIDCASISRIVLTSVPCYKEHVLRIYNIYLTDQMPEIEPVQSVLIDELGQWTPKSWPQKTPDRDACSHYLRELLKQANQAPDAFSNPDWNKYGGLKTIRFEATGWFHTHYDGQRWWLVDPAGNGFLSSGIDCIAPGTDTRIDPVRTHFGALQAPVTARRNPFHPDIMIEMVNYGEANLRAAFGEQWWEAWARITKYYMHTWGFNTIGNWSEHRFITWAKLPYVLPLSDYSPVGYPATKVSVFRDFPDVYAPEFAENAAVFAAALKDFSSDPYMIGYFMRNEPEWAFVYDLNIAEEMLANPAPLESKHVLIRELQNKYTAIDSLNAAWNTNFESFSSLLMPIARAASLSSSAKNDLRAFSVKMITRYVEIPARLCRTEAPNHLNLGMRYAYITDESLLSGYENFDVFSINSYQMDPSGQIESVAALLNKPVMIGEFHHGALDRGLTATGIRAVANQQERGQAYRYYVEQALLNPYFLGAHYFMYNDQSCLGRFDGENYQIGFIDVCMKPYPELTTAAAACHTRMYAIAAGSLPPTTRRPVEIPTIHY